MDAATVAVLDLARAKMDAGVLGVGRHAGAS
jgi:hypothetical protein